jgi:hypothetical protein
MSLRLGLAGLLCPLLIGCVPLPVQVAGPVEGSVLDASSGQPIEGALVVIRFEGIYDEVLPESELLAHREVRSGALGRFRTGPVVGPGFMPWPWLRTRARVVSVLRKGYRCAEGRLVPREGELRIALHRAANREEQRDSCRPAPAPPGEIPRYSKAWKNLQPLEIPDPGPTASEKEIDRALAVRAALGFGSNCRGPVEDLALDPSGRRVAFTVRTRERIDVWVSDSRATGATAVAHAGAPVARMLAWTASGELALRDGADGLENIWTPLDHPIAFPASQAPASEGPVLAFEPADHFDEATTRWMGRAFVTLRELDAATGLPRDLLRVTGPGHTSRTLTLPGEACTRDGRFGQPHYRVSDDGRFGFDVRFLGGGCRAVSIELETGLWKRLDDSLATATCRKTRRIPASHLKTALRGYLQEIDAVLTRSGLDPASAFSLRIADSGETRIEILDPLGARRVLPVSDFPIATPLRRIDVSVLGDPTQGGQVPAQLEPL